VDSIIYLNHDSKQQGLQYIHDLIKAKSLFKTDNQPSYQKKGQLSFFDHAFGYMLQQELVDPFIEEFLNLMLIHNIKLAILYTKSRSTSQNTLYIKLANTLLKEILEW
ncbi:MAG: hypothetical protein K2F55_04840, partial [Erysipelotrichaceae bacterium]|nr:hypothetical protein [Erysipelotrichaceae bacterium]